MSTVLVPSISPVTDSYRRADLGFFFLYSFVSFFGFVCLVLVVWIYQCFKRGQSRRIVNAGMAHIVIEQENCNHNTSIEVIYDCQPTYTSPSLTELQYQSQFNNARFNNLLPATIIQGEIIPIADISNTEAVNTSVLSSSSLPHDASYAIVPAIPVSTLFPSSEIQISSSPPVSASQFTRL